MSRIRRFLTFAAEIKHFQKQVLSKGALTKCAIRSGKHDAGGTVLVQTFCFKLVIPFAVKYYRTVLLTGLILYPAEFSLWQTA